MGSKAKHSLHFWFPALKNLAGHVSIEFLKLIMGFLVEFAIKVQGKRGKKAK